MMFSIYPPSGNPKSLGIVQYSEIDFLLKPEAGAYEHWILDRKAASLTGLLNGRMLTAQGAAPVYANGYLSLLTAQGNALLTPKADNREQTMCVVARQLAGGAVKTLAGTRVSGVSGSSIFSTSNNLFGNQQPSFQIGPIAETTGAWQFTALSETAQPGTTTNVLYRGGVVPVTLSGGSLKIASSSMVALGNGYAAGAAGLSQQFAEFILFDRALSIAELKAVYERTRQRMAMRGIDLPVQVG